jgi:hypothetical protein
MSAQLAGLDVADPPERWSALGFTVDGHERVGLGGVAVQLGVSGEGITGWTLTGVDGVVGDIDGLATAATAHPAPGRVGQHDNGAIAIDHIVIVTGGFERTSAALAACGIPLRLVRESDADRHRQGFRRLGPAIMEIVEVPDLDGAARFWGLVVVVKDLEDLHRRLDPHLHEIRPAVQEGRRIATLDGSAGLTPRIAFMDPE